MIVKLERDHRIRRSPFCGEIREILAGAEYSPNIAVAIDIEPTEPHYHERFDEIYFVLDGHIQVRLYEPKRNEITTQTLGANELVVIPRGTHHAITEASGRNRLCVITVPGFDPEDEHPSDRL